MAVDYSNETTTSKQDIFIQMLVAGQTIIDAVQRAGIAEKTAYNWMKLPHFQAAYAEAKKRVFDESLSLLMTDISDARATLKAIMKDDSVTPGARVRAAQ